MQKTTDFVITVHDRQRVIEVVYPSHPTAEAYFRYEQEIRAAILRVDGEWDCLVDQRALKVAPPEIAGRLASLNAWARQHGMRRTTRVVSDSAISEIQARRIAREAQLSEEAKLFHSREEAWKHLVG